MRAPEPARRRGRGVLHFVVFAAGPAADAARGVRLALDAGWDVFVIPTPSALHFVDADDLVALTGQPARARWRRPGEPGSLPPSQGVIVAPATYNTINKWAGGAADTYALGQLAEAVGRRVPVVVLPFVNTALAANSAYRRSLEALRSDGALVLDGAPDADGVRRGVSPHPPGSGEDFLHTFPWHDAVDMLTLLADRPSPN